MVQYSQENICVGLFLIKLQALRPATLLKTGSSTGVFLWILRIFMNSFFYEHFQWLPLCLLKSLEEESVEKRSVMKNISFNFYQQVLVLVNTEMQIQLCKYWNCSPFYSYFFFKFSLFWFLRVHFLCFHFWHSEKYLLLHLLFKSGH